MRAVPSSLAGAGIALLLLVAGCTQTGQTAKHAPPDSDGQFGDPAGSDWDADKWTRESSTRMEAELAKRSPGSADKQVPPEKLRDRSLDIEGDWIGRTGMDSAQMSIKRRSEREYDIDFATGGCLGHWKLKRTGSYHEGVLTLDRPVQEYCPITFKTLYAVRVDGKELLLPASNIDDLLRDLYNSGNSRPGTIGVSFYTYGRRSDRESKAALQVDEPLSRMDAP